MRDKILVIDDDGQLTAFLQRFLTKQGYRASVAATAKEARRLLAQEEFALVVLDLILPDGDGLDIAGEIHHNSHTPIIMLTARDEVYDRIVGLEIGADDYVTKPYEPRELFARIKAVLRRTRTGDADAPVPTPRAQKLVFFDLEFDLSLRRLRRVSSHETIALTGTEFTLLRLLVENAGEVLPRALIMNSLYGTSVTVTDRAIDAHVTRLRRKIDPAAADVSLIRAVHGEGYVFAATPEQR